MWVLVPLFILAGVSLRLASLGFFSADMPIFLDWYDHLARGGFGALREPFSTYTPSYLYLLFLVTQTAGFVPEVTAIKLIPIAFDFLSAFLVYKILNLRYPGGVTAWLGAALFLLLPTVWLNSSYWGQVDGIYTFFLLACMFFLMKDQPFPAMIFLGISFSFKAQAVFLGPLVLLLMIRKKIPWYFLGIVPAVYALMMIPAALAGRPVIELLTVYIAQADVYHSLSLLAPNIYILMLDLYNTPIILAGMTLTLILASAWAILYARKFQELTPQVILWCGLISVVLMPFFLPKMHDRYFYPADVLSFLVAFYVPRGWLLALGYQWVSGSVYFLYFKWSTNPIESLLSGNILIVAFLVNLVLLGFLFLYPWKLTPAHLTPDTERHAT